MSILKEQQASQKYILVKCPTNQNLVKITFDNVAKVEAMIQLNSTYNQIITSSSIQNLRVVKRQLDPLHDYRPEFKNIVCAINNENRTRMSIDEQADVVNYLVENRHTLIERLYQRDFCLVCEISKCARRKNYSFATKFCHYMCYYLFKGKKQQDNFSIYDRIVSRELANYATYYKILKNDGSQYTIKDFNKYQNYSVYSDVIDRIIDASGSKISRNGFDHLLWYFHK